MYIYIYVCVFILFMLTDRCAVSICDAPPNGGRVTICRFHVCIFFCGFIRRLLSGCWWLQGWWSLLTFRFKLFQLAQSPPTSTENQWYRINQWIGFHGDFFNLDLETIDFPMKIMGLPLKVLAQQQQEASTQSLQQAMAGGFSPPKMEQTMNRYPLVNIQKAMENDHRNSGFSHEKWWFSMANC